MTEGTICFIEGCVYGFIGCVVLGGIVALVQKYYNR